MKTSSKFLNVLALLILTVSICICSGASADTTGIYLSNSTELGEDGLPDDAVLWYKHTNGVYYFFLPGQFDLSEMYIWYSGNVNKSTIDKVTYQNGDAIKNMKTDGTYKIKFGSRTYSVILMQGSQIPAMFLKTESGSMEYVDKKKKNREPGEMLLLDTQGTLCENIEFIKLRGNTSAKFEKKGYTVKLENGQDLCGMGKAKKWVLTSNARDHSLIRNQMIYAMADYVQIPYTPECVQIDLYLNHEYNGTYILQEKVEIGEERIDIYDLKSATQEVNDEELDSYPKIGSKKSVDGQYKCFDIPNDPDDITGGYLIEYESAESRYSEEECAYTTEHGNVLVVKEPEEISEGEMQYISSFLQGFENAIFADDGIDPETGKHYSEYMDFESLVLKYMIEEITKNLDGSKSSQFFYKPSDSESLVAFAGPAWDYDSTFGDYAREKDSKDLIKPTGFYHTKTSRNAYWWARLCAKEDFQGGIRKMWNERYAQAIRYLLGMEKDETGTVLSIDEYINAIYASAEMNFIRWPMKQSSENIAHTGKTIDKNITYLKDFVKERYEWLESEWGNQE